MGMGMGMGINVGMGIGVARTCPVSAPGRARERAFRRGTPWRRGRQLARTGPPAPADRCAPVVRHVRPTGRPTGRRDSPSAMDVRQSRKWPRLCRCIDRRAPSACSESWSFNRKPPDRAVVGEQEIQPGDGAKSCGESPRTAERLGMSMSSPYVPALIHEHLATPVAICHDSFEPRTSVCREAIAFRPPPSRVSSTAVGIYPRRRAVRTGHTGLTASSEAALHAV